MANPRKGRGTLFIKELENYYIYKENKGKIFTTKDLMKLFNYKCNSPTQTSIKKYIKPESRGFWSIKDDLVLMSQDKFCNLSGIPHFYSARLPRNAVFNVIGTCYRFLIVKKELLPFWTLEEYGGWLS